jgi:hypothetical protein
VTKDILIKLTAELEAGITTEVQTVYVLAGIRKIIERDKSDDRYPALKFHCDWALHAELSWNKEAKCILAQFEAAYDCLKAHVDIEDLPDDLGREIRRISSMKDFRTELKRFLSAYKLPPLTYNDGDGWSHFLHLYTQVIEDIPLVLAKGEHRVSQVVVGFELARRVRTDHLGNSYLAYKVIWNIYDSDGGCGEVFVLNDFEVPTAGSPETFGTPHIGES